MKMAPRSVRRRADREGWAHDEEAVRGGKQKRYRLDLLPPDVQEAYTLWRAREAGGGLPALVEDLSAPPVPLGRTWATLPASCRTRATQRLSIVNELRQAVKEAPGAKCAQIARVARLRAVAPNTLRSWLATAEQALALAREAGADTAAAQALALAPAYGKNKGRALAFSEEAVAWALALYLREARLNLSEVYRQLIPKAREEMWDVGSYDTLARIIEQRVPEAVLTATREGLKKFEARCIQKITRNYDEIWPNFMWVTDHHILDVFVLDSGRTVRPWVTVWMDMKSRSIMGWCLALSPSSKTVALALRHAMLPKAHAQFPQHGLPLAVYLDNGKDMRSEYLRGRPVEPVDYPADMLRFAALGIDPFYIDMKYDPDDRAWTKKRGTELLQVKGFRVGGVFTRLGVSPHYATAYHPWAKPIERMFREFVQNFSRMQPGWCGTSPEQKPEKLVREVKSGKLLSFEQCAERWEHVAIHGYNGRPHGALDGLTPTEAWMGGLPAEGPTTISPELLEFALLKQERVKVYNWGFNLHGRRFELDIPATLEGAALLNDVVESFVEVHHDFELRTVRLYKGGRYLCDGRPLRLGSFIDQQAQVNQDKLKLQAYQRQVIHARVAELTRPPLSAQPDAYITAMGTLAGPDESAALPAPEPPAPVGEEGPPRIFFSDEERYKYLLPREIHGEALTTDELAFMREYEASEEYQTSKKRWEFVVKRLKGGGKS